MLPKCTLFSRSFLHDPSSPPLLLPLLLLVPLLFRLRRRLEPRLLKRGAEQRNYSEIPEAFRPRVCSHGWTIEAGAGNSFFFLRVCLDRFSFTLALVLLFLQSSTGLAYFWAVLEFRPRSLVKFTNGGFLFSIFQERSNVLCILQIWYYLHGIAWFSLAGHINVILGWLIPSSRVLCYPEWITTRYLYICVYMCVYIYK